MQYSGANGEQAAAENRAMVLNAIHRGAPISRTEIARQSRVTKQAVTRIVDKLLDEGLIMEARRRHGLRGQPAIELEIDPEGVFAIGANIDRDHLTIVAVDAVGNVRGRLHFEERFMLPHVFMRHMEDALSSFLRRKVVRESRLAGIGLAIPDWLGDVPVVDRPDAYMQWTRFDVRQALSRMSDHPVFIDNDANAAALREIEYGLGTHMGSFFYVLVSACLGGCLVIDGVRHKGSSGLGGEIGWLPVIRDEDAEADRSRPLGDIFSLSLLTDHLKRHDVTIVKPADLLALDARGREIVTRWLKEIARDLADAIINIGMVVDPEAILIGGRLPVRLIDDLIVDVHDEIRRRGLPAPSLHRAASSEDAAALGAAAMPLADRLCLASAEPSQRSRIPLSGPPLHLTADRDWADSVR